MAKKSQGEAWQLEQKIREDRTKYKSMETAHAICEGIPEELEKCALAHHDKIAEPEFFLVMLIGDDPLIKTVIRRKFYAWPYLPQPRPNQSVWIYTKATGTIDFLWALPEPEAMAYLSTMRVVDKAYERMKQWCDWFYSGKFPEHVRRHFQRDDWLMESEFLARHSAELSKASLNQQQLLGTKTLDPSEVAVNEIANPIETILAEKRLNRRRKAKNAKGNV